MKALASQEPVQATSQDLRRPQVIARIVYHCDQCDPFGPLYSEKSGGHGRKITLESVPCSCRTTMCERCWEAHGQYKQPCKRACDCHGTVAKPATERKLSAAIDRLRGDSAIERLVAGLDKDAEDAAGRVKGVLSLCGRDLTDSEVARVRAQLRAELVSFLIKANIEMDREWFDLLASRGIRD